MKKFLASAAIILSTVLATGCTPNISPDVDQSTNANRVTQTIQGKIVGMRTVTIKGNSNNVGTLAGAGIGGVAGSALGGGSRMPIIGAIGGAVLGGIAGDVAQDKLSQQQGVEYIIKTHSGKLITVVQAAGNEALRIGQKVFVIEGEHARIIADNG